MQLFTQDERQQFHYLGEYDIVPKQGPMPQMTGGPSVDRPRRNIFASPFLKRYKKTAIGMAAGLILGVLFITLGFFKTLLLAILIAAGFVVGGFFDGNPVVLKFLDSIG